MLVRSEWLPVTRLPAGAASARCVVSVHLHAGHNLGLGRASPPHARVELRLGEDRAWVSRPKGPSHNPTFKQVKIISKHIFKIFFIQPSIFPIFFQNIFKKYFAMIFIFNLLYDIIVQGTMFLSSHPSEDSLVVVVEDQRSGAVLGRARLGLVSVQGQARRWSLSLDTGGDSDTGPGVTLSVQLLSY